MRKTLAAALVFLALCGCEPHAKPIQSPQTVESGGREIREGTEYKDHLSDMILGSDRIVVTEHSYQYDFDDTADHEAGQILIPRKVVYGIRELTQQQKDLFSHTIGALDPTTQVEFPACIFEPHHTIQFYSAGKLISTMAICFQCGQVEWDAIKVTPPSSLYSGLATFIKGIGFEAERDWPALAKQHVQ